MIRTNLSTRPFYNERVVQLWLLALAVIVAAATASNVVSVIRYSQTDTELATEAVDNEARAGTLMAEATRLRGSVDLQQIARASAEARLANSLIDRRMFSWTELFDRLEATFPDNVRVRAVRPRSDARSGLVLSIAVTARSVDDVDELIRNLEGTGSFSALLSVQEQFNGDGLLEATLEGNYAPASTGRTP